MKVRSQLSQDQIGVLGLLTELNYNGEPQLFYLLVAQRRMHVERCARQASESWLLTEFREPDQEIILDSIGCRIRLAEL